MSYLDRMVSALVKSGDKEVTLVVNRDYKRNARVVRSAPPAQKVDYLAKHYLEEHRPSFWTKIGLVQTNKTRIDISPRTGETVGYNDLVVRCPVSGRYEITTFLYAYRNGRIAKLKEFPTRFAARAPA